jgi:hypothetical protein
MSESTIAKIETILGEAAAGIKHESQVLLNALKELFAHHQAVANGLPEPSTPEVAAPVAVESAVIEPVVVTEEPAALPTEASPAV